MHETGGQGDGFAFSELTLIDFALQGAGQASAGLDGEGHGGVRPIGVAAKQKEFVRGHGVNHAMHKISRAVRVDAPSPAQIDIDVGVVLGHRGQLATVWIGGVHQDKASLWVAPNEFTQMRGPHRIDDHIAIARQIAGVNLEGQVVLSGQLRPARPAPITQTQFFFARKIETIYGFVECTGDIGLAALLPQQRALIGSL